MNYRRLFSRICITVMFLILISYAIAGATGIRHIPLWELIAPTIAILNGLYYLRVTAPKERGNGT